MSTYENIKGSVEASCGSCIDHAQSVGITRGRSDPDLMQGDVAQVLMAQSMQIEASDLNELPNQDICLHGADLPHNRPSVGRVEIYGQR